MPALNAARVFGALDRATEGGTRAATAQEVALDLLARGFRGRKAGEPATGKVQLVLSVMRKYHIVRSEGYGTFVLVPTAVPKTPLERAQIWDRVDNEVKDRRAAAISLGQQARGRRA